MVTVRANIYESLDTGMVVQYCNFAGGSFHTKKLCSRLYSMKLSFIPKNEKNRFLNHPLGDLGVAYALRL